MLPKARYAELQEATDQGLKHHLTSIWPWLGLPNFSEHLPQQRTIRDTVSFQTQGSFFPYCVLKGRKTQLSMRVSTSLGAVRGSKVTQEATVSN